MIVDHHIGGVAGTMVDDVLRRIRSGELRRGDRLGSEVKLAKTYDISVMTVRAALETLIADGVIERRRGKGLFVAEPFRASRVLQVVVPTLKRDSAVQLIHGFQACVRDTGLDVQICDAHGDFNRALELVRRLPRGTGRGAVIRYIHDPRFATAIYELHRQHFPFVLVGQQMADLEVASVTSDNYGGGYLSGQELLKLGHRRIGRISHAGVRTEAERLDGLRDALNDAGHPFKRSWRREFRVDDPLGDWSSAIHDATAAIMDQPDPPTVLLFGDDRSAILGCQSLGKLGYRVPDDVSVVGNGDSDICTLVQPPLTTLKQPWLQQGRRAYRLLERLVSGQPPEEFHIVLPVTWVARDSVASPGSPAENGDRPASICQATATTGEDR